MLTRSRYVFGFSAILSTMMFVASASAQNANLGQRIEGQIMNGVGNMMPGTQPMYQPPYYGAGQPYYSPYSGQAMNYGYGSPAYQPQSGVRYNRRGLPFLRGGRNAYQQAGAVQSGQNAYQQAGTVQTRPRYDQQLQPTSYTGPAVQRYQIPSQYTGTPAGYVINYGGRNYLSGSDGTMTPYNGPVAPR
jgi:hypothetical protein